jgi:sec-independent protein translocase protein TatB
MFGIGGQELILILLLALIVLGPKKLPEMAKTLGKALGEFQRATNDLKKEIDVASMEKAVEPAAAPAPEAAAAEQPSAEVSEPAQQGNEPPEKKTDEDELMSYRPGEIEG